MIGDDKVLKVIITGHGMFSKGLNSAIKMIAGEKDNITTVIFEDDTDINVYTENINKEIKNALEEYDGVVIYTDLMGGTPFNISVLESQKFDNVEVISGTNLPMLIEGIFLSQNSNSAQQLSEESVKIGKDGIGLASLINEKNNDESDEKDGI